MKEGHGDGGGHGAGNCFTTGRTAIVSLRNMPKFFNGSNPQAGGRGAGACTKSGHSQWSQFKRGDSHGETWCRDDGKGKG